MVTGGNAKRTLYLRMAHANKLSADLLLSIHRHVGARQVYKKWEFDGKPHIYSDRFKGYSIFVSDRNAEPKTSLQLRPHSRQRTAGARALAYTPHYTEAFMGHNRHALLDDKAGVYRYDALFVLKKSRMPAALLEAGSIVNRDEESGVGHAGAPAADRRGGGRGGRYVLPGAGARPAASAAGVTTSDAIGNERAACPSRPPFA